MIAPRVIRLRRLIRTVHPSLEAGLVALAIACAAPPSAAGFGAPNVAPPSGPYWLPAQRVPALRYAGLPRPTCEAELTRRGVTFRRVEQARGVLEPVRIDGALHGVTYHTGLPPSQRASSPLEIVDCRLALALDDFSAQLASHGIVEVTHFSMYRPPSTRWPAERIASRHPGGLAIDAASFLKNDGTNLVVERDFHGRIGTPTCGAGTGPHPPSPEALELRQIVCDAADAKLFNVELTPDFNWAHRNHFHLEVIAGSPWFYVH